jgi:hypothetical protein
MESLYADKPMNYDGPSSVAKITGQRKGAYSYYQGHCGRCPRKLYEAAFLRALSYFFVVKPRQIFIQQTAYLIES